MTAVLRPNSARAALAFLTRLPGGKHPEGLDAVAASVPWFPIVGALVGGVGAGVYVAASQVLPSLTSAVLAFAVTAMITGGLHEDGLGDAFDALAGGSTPERRLEILLDSTHGTFGVLSIVLMTVLKITALAPLAGWDAVAALVTAHALGRSAAVGLMATAPQAVGEGLSADYSRMLTPGLGAAGALLGVVVAVIAFQASAIVFVLGAVASAVVIGVWAQRRIGGVVGDLLGAAEQFTEATVLLTATALLT